MPSMALRGILFMDRPTRIAFLSEHASPLATLGGADAGGQNIYVGEVSRNLGRYGFAVDVFTRRDSPDMPEVVEWGTGVRVVNLVAGPVRPRTKDELWPYMSEFRDSLLRFMEHDETHYDLVHGNFWMSGWVATEVRRRLDIPVVHIFHAMGKTKRFHQKKVDTSPGDRIKTELDIIRVVDRIIAQCPNERSELVKDYGANPDKIVLIPSAVNTRIFKPLARDAARHRIGLDTNGKVIVYVGRMLARKDIRNVIRALALLVRKYESSEGSPTTLLTLMVVGGETLEPDPEATPEIGELQKLAAELGITETIKDGETGFLVPPRDPEALAARLQQLLSQPELGMQMGLAARRRVEREFTWSIVAMRTGGLYGTLLAEQMHETLPRETQSIASFPTVSDNNS